MATRKFKIDSHQLIFISELGIKTFEVRNEDQLYSRLQIMKIIIKNQGIHKIQNSRIKKDFE